MAYQKQIWENLPSQNTPVSAERLNHMEDGIYEANEGLIEIHNSYSTSTTDSYSANYVNELNSYSTTKTRCGTWTDGRPVYRIVITVTTPSSTLSWGDVYSDSDVDFIVRYGGKREGATVAMTMPLNTNDRNIWFGVDKTSHNIQMAVDNNSDTNASVVLWFDFVEISS